MKKVLAFLLIIAFSIFLISCKGEENPPINNDPAGNDPAGNDPVNESSISVKENSFIFEFKNDYLDIVIDKNNGSINQIKNVKTGTDYIENSEGGNFALDVDLSTSDPFKTDRLAANIKTITSRSFKPVITYELKKDLNICLAYDVAVASYGFIHVNMNILLEEESNELVVNYEIDNQLSCDSVVTRFIGLIVSGLKDKNMNLLYPLLEGKIYENAVYRAKSGDLSLRREYPAQMSMQLLELYNDEEALYYYMKDSSREYKTINFGDFSNSFDKELESNDDIVSMSITEYPYISSGAKKTTFDVVLGISDNSWYGGGDSYRDFLIEAGMARNYNDYVKYWKGTITTTIANYDDGMISSYLGINNPADILAASDKFNVDTLMVMGWHQGGFDSKYPDYDFYEGENFSGKEGFKQMIDKAHENGDYVIPYLNGVMVCENANFANAIGDEANHKNIELCTVKKVGFSSEVSNYMDYTYVSTYYNISHSGLNFYQACPKSKIFQDQFLGIVEKLVECGVNGLWLDQLLEYPSHLCYDPSHGHTNPATASGEGYTELLTKMENIFIEHGVTDYLFFAEGVTDAYMAWMDVAGLNWNRNLYQSNMYPHISEYILPTKQLGIAGSGTLSKHAYAFLFASPLIDGNNMKDKQITDLYQANKDIYYEGRYLHLRGMEVNNDNILASLIQSSDGKSLGIQLYNNSALSESFKLKINLSDLGLGDKTIKSVTNLFNGSSLALQGDEIEITLESDEFLALRIVYE